VSSHVARAQIAARGARWGLEAVILLTGLLAGALGYLISLDPPWLRLGLDPTRPADLLTLLAGAAAAVVVLRWPEAGLLGLVAMLYSNASEVGVRVHRLPSVLQFLALLLLLAMLGRQLAARRRAFVWDRRTLLLVAYGIVLFASSTLAVDRRLADEEIVEHLRSLIVFFVVINLLTSARTLWHTAWALVLVGAFLGTVSTYQVATSSYDVDLGGFGRVKLAQIVGDIREPRISGPLSDPNFYAQVLVSLAPVALYRLWDEPSGWLRAIAAYGLAVVLLALVFTYSRGGALALGLVLLLAVLHKRLKVRYFLLGLLVLAPLALTLPPRFEGRLSTLNQLIFGPTAGGVHADSALEERILLQRAAWEMFVDHPFLGVGPGNYSEHYEVYARRVGSTVSSYEDFDEQRFPHSLYLEIGAETGLVGLTLVACVVATTLFSFSSAARRFGHAGDVRSASVVSSLALGCIGYLTTSLFLHGHYLRYFWLLVALAAAAERIARRDQPAA
jgi:putative inorganic carbon (hco3(-)) transporter